MVRDHFSLTLLIPWFSLYDTLGVSAVRLFVLLVSFASLADVQAQGPPDHQNVPNQTSVTDDPHEGHPNGRWEGSPEGKAFSEFAHHFAGSFDVLFGLAELGSALQYPLPYWLRFILPGALSVVGGFTLIWSDHDAWPIGSLQLCQTLLRC